MEAKYTYITEKLFNEHCSECSHKCDVYPSICREHLQAEISFKAGEQQGIEKVVSLIENNFNEVVNLLAGYDEETRKQYHIAFDGFGKLVADWVRQGFKESIKEGK